MASSSKKKKKKKVCVVGAGVSGLVSARELRREGHHVTVMEQSGGVGGQWLYDPRTDASDPLGAAGVHSGVYASLRLNTPRESTEFSDFPFCPSNGGDARRYPGHAEFLRYIREFCDAFGLMDVVRLNTKVLRVAMLAPRGHDGGGVMRWTVRSSSRHGDCEGEVVVTTEETFDAVVVAVGQFTQPRLPTINGMDKWSRRQLHSHSYRSPESFEDQVVVVVGCHPSGADIALELREVAREVHISVKSMDDDRAVFPGMRRAVCSHHNLHLHLQIERLCEDGQVTFADGSCVVADSVIYCTGYDYSFPFLDTGGVVTWTTTAWARCSSTRSRRRWRRRCPSWAYPGWWWCRGSSRRRRGGWRRRCPAGARCRRRRRCCAPPRSTTAPGRRPACPGASRTPSSSTWTTATSSGRRGAASRGCRSGRRSSCARPLQGCAMPRRASVTTTATATWFSSACKHRAGSPAAGRRRRRTPQQKTSHD